MRQIKIDSARYVGGYRLHLVFTDKTEQQIDFGPFLKSSFHPDIKKYLDKKLFKTYLLHNGELMWNDYELIFPIHDLYTNSILKNEKRKSRKVS